MVNILSFVVDIKLPFNLIILLFKYIISSFVPTSDGGHTIVFPLILKEPIFIKNGLSSVFNTIFTPATELIVP